LINENFGLTTGTRQHTFICGRSFTRLFYRREKASRCAQFSLIGYGGQSCWNYKIRRAHVNSFIQFDSTSNICYSALSIYVISFTMSKSSPAALNLRYLYDRPCQPCFREKGIDGTVTFDIPGDYYVSTRIAFVYVSRHVEGMLYARGNSELMRYQLLTICLQHFGLH